MAKSWRLPDGSGRPKRNACRYLEHGDSVLAFDVGQSDLAECLLTVNTNARPPFRVQTLRIVPLGLGTITESVKQLVHAARLSQQAHWASADFVVIEQQARINSKMVALSHALQAVCLTLNSERQVLFASSVHKLRLFESLGPHCASLIDAEPKGGSVQKRKTIRKKNAVRIATTLLDAGGGSAVIIEAKPGHRDDLADALVHASGFVYRNALLV
jgi:hypothetical protein